VPVRVARVGGGGVWRRRRHGTGRTARSRWS